MSVGKSAPIGETLTIRFAASQEPGERQRSDVLSTDCFVQRCGTVHDISCCSHLADWPPETAAVCAAVGCGPSASSPPVVVVAEVVPPEPPDVFDVPEPATPPPEPCFR